MKVGEQIQAFLYRAVYTRALNVLKHRDIVSGYEAVMLEIHKRGLSSINLTAMMW